MGESSQAYLGKRGSARSGRNGWADLGANSAEQTEPGCDHLGHGPRGVLREGDESNGFHRAE